MPIIRMGTRWLTGSRQEWGLEETRFLLQESRRWASWLPERLWKEIREAKAFEDREGVKQECRIRCLLEKPCGKPVTLRPPGDQLLM